MHTDRISLAHGSGTYLTQQLIDSIFKKFFNNKILKKLDDAAVFPVARGRIAFSTDAFTVKPIFFPGGDIGVLAVCGTLNDLAAQGARPLALAASFIIEEGFLIDDLKRIVKSMAACAKKNNVSIVAGDTKVVSRKEADGVFITTSGIGCVHKQFKLSCEDVNVDDAIILSGAIAEHGMCIVNEREGLGFEPPIRSDVACVYPLVRKCLPFAKYIHAMRDPTRGGIASVLHEISLASNVGIRLFEEAVPVRNDIARACALLGLESYQIANEGKMIFFVDPRKAKKVLLLMRQHSQGKKAAIIGTVQRKKQVSLITHVGAERLLMWPEGEIVPRIC